MLIDTHAHLTDRKFEDAALIIEDSFNAGIANIIVPTVDIDDARKAIYLAEQYKNIYALGGIHPETIMANFDLLNNTEELIYELRMVLKSSDKVIGVGEIGLDFFQDKAKWTAEKQNDVFQGQLDLAVDLDLPAVIHIRNAEVELIKVLKSRHLLPRGQFHCWGGSKEALKLVLDKGFYVSFAGNITFKTAENLRELIKYVPRDRLLLETDSPLLAPEPVRGTINVPKNVKILVEFQSKLLNVPYETLIEETTKNAKCLFSAI